MYVLAQGDVVYINFDPVLGSEQGGRRTALVLSNKKHNGIVKLAIIVPITSIVKGYYTEIKVPNGYKTTGVILTNHIRSVSWEDRNVNYVETFDKKLVKEIIRRIGVLLNTE